MPSAAAGSAARSVAARSVAASAAPKAQARARSGDGRWNGPSRTRQEGPLSFVYLTSRADFVPATLASQLENRAG